MKPAVCVIIITWNGLDDTLACLQTVYDQRYDNLHTIVVDNGSSDGTAGRINERFPQAEQICLPENIGAVRGYNVGFRKGLERDYRYLFLLNNDTLADPQLAGDLTRDFEQDLARSLPIRLDEWRSRGLLERSREWFWGLFGELF